MKTAKNTTAPYISWGFWETEVFIPIKRTFSHFLNLQKKLGMKKDKVAVHLFTDGRDTLPKSSIGFVKTLQKEMSRIGVGYIATVVGRYYSMDRDKRWKRTKLAYDLLVSAKGTKSPDALSAIEKSHKEGITDEFIKPVAIGGYDGMKDNDAIIFYNYRWDRARQITMAFTEGKFKYFNALRKKLIYVCMMEYYEGVNSKIAFKPVDMGGEFPRLLSQKGLKQLKVAETEKYAHITFFFNGLIEKPYKGEDRILVPSNKKVPTYDFAPEMKAHEIKDKVIKNIKKYDVIICNFANGDMVGHTGVKSAIIKACQVVDECLKEIVDKILEIGGIAIITSDHGNCEKISEDDGSPNTSHTTSKVPFILIGNNIDKKLKDNSKLANIAPTMLELLHLKIPSDMEESLLI